MRKLLHIPERLRPWLKTVLAALLGGALTWLWARFGLPGQPPPVPIDFQRAPAVAPTVGAGVPDSTRDGEPVYFCGRIETLRDYFTAAPWPSRRLPWTVNTTGYRGSLSRDEVVQAFDLAWKSWAQHLDFDPVLATSEAGALVRSHFATIDGKGKVLAWSELADGSARPKEQRYDLEDWVISERPPASRIDLLRVAAHEIGHVLGLVHDSSDATSLMAPMYSPTIRLPTERDVQRAVTLGYQRRPSATPAPALQVPVNASDLIKVLREAGYKVEPVKP